MYTILLRRVIKDTPWSHKITLTIFWILPNLFPFYPWHTNLIGFWDIKKLFWYVELAFDVPPKFLMFRLCDTIQLKMEIQSRYMLQLYKVNETTLEENWFLLDVWMYRGIEN